MPTRIVVYDLVSGRATNMHAIDAYDAMQRYPDRFTATRPAIWPPPPPPTAPGAPAAAPTPAAVGGDRPPAPGVDRGFASELDDVEMMGPKIKQHLLAHGIDTLAKLAAHTPDSLAAELKLPATNGARIAKMGIIAEARRILDEEQPES